MTSLFSESQSKSNEEQKRALKTEMKSKEYKADNSSHASHHTLKSRNSNEMINDELAFMHFRRVKAARRNAIRNPLNLSRSLRDKSYKT